MSSSSRHVRAARRALNGANVKAKSAVHDAAMSRAKRNRILTERRHIMDWLDVPFDCDCEIHKYWREQGWIAQNHTRDSGYNSEQDTWTLP